MRVPGSSAPPDASGLGRPLVAGLFASSCLLSVVSWYTTQQGMALYLSSWFALLASLGVQSALVLVAWLAGVAESRRGLLVAVYVVTATVSIAFSYVSLHTWFAARERPAAIERKLYDALGVASGQAQELLSAAIAEGERHVLALEELAAAEKTHGHVSQARDADPWLDRVREAVAREAATYGAAYPEGAGPGLRYTAFDRHARLARQTVARLSDSRKALSAFQAALGPLQSTEAQLRAFREAFDPIPWAEVRETLHADVRVPAVPAYSDFVDRAASGQEALVTAFTELATAPTSRHVLALALATFIDVIVFLLAHASAPLLMGSPEQRWVAAAATLDSVDPQVFARALLRKLEPGEEGEAQIDVSGLTPGERQLLLVLASRGLAAPLRGKPGRAWLLDAAVHRALLEPLAERGLPLRASGPAVPQPAAGA